jgi:hypothetical protein
MKELIEINGQEYMPAAKVMGSFEIWYKAMYTWIENGMLPRPIKRWRRIYFDHYEIDQELLTCTR